MRYVMDASALLAMLLREDGGDAVAAVLEVGCIGSVNLAEVATVFARRGAPAERIRAIVDALALPVLTAEAELALAVGLLAPATREFGSSLGDRYALALSARLGATLVTTDRWLGDAAAAVGVAVLQPR